MKFLLMIYTDDSLLEALPEGAFDQMMHGCITHADALEAEGRLIGSQQLEDASTARTLRVRDGALRVTDGPFAETKEFLAGYSLIEADSLDEAVEHGTRLRLRPILMTAAATVFALVPMSLGLTGGGVFISKPLAIVVIGGLVSSTLLTLVLVPVLYTLVERSRDRRIAKRAERRARREERRAASAEETTDIFEVAADRE